MEAHGTVTAGPAGRLWNAARRGDLARLAIVLSRKLGCGVVRLDRLWILARWAWAAMPRPAGLLTHPVSEVGVAGLPGLATSFPHNAAVYEMRMRRGDRCLVVKPGETPAAMTWMRRGGDCHTASGCRLTLPRASCWIYDTFVASAMRGHGLFGILMQGALDEARRLGLAWAFVAVHHDNEVSVRAHARAGWNPVMVIDSLQAGPCAWYRLARWSGRPIWRFSRTSDPPRVALSQPAP